LFRRTRETLLMRPAVSAERTKTSTPVHDSAP
jgi:hypothetical protein